ncbi:hypothetical protein D081_0568 [Anaerovibrio sp. JC8]|uniref:DUF6718 family protein n=1 Tax=Anaerovibrio sp. JC8 TaxID=1240085 RepID=UPI000A0E6721|nr:DUF6718 family protein [Anaerovibrio sp. JC8]ORU01120.1 hypothetical protein D081_0568 [Anaerovibrio sp. JC8]
MCFLIAKDFNKPGCVALQMRGGAELVELKKKLNSKVDISRIQLVTISRPSAFGEYEPYDFVSNSQEFEERVIDM